MRKIVQHIVAGAGVLGISITAAHAEGIDPKEVPTCKAHLVPGIRSILPESPLTPLLAKCRNDMYACDDMLDAAKGKPDPAFTALLPDLLFFYDVVDGGHCVKAAASLKSVYEASVAFQVPNVREQLVNQIDSELKMTELVCADKDEIALALWYTGEPEAADAVIGSYNNLLCTASHVNQTAPRIVDWPLSDEQRAAIEKTCVDGVFGEKLRNHKDALPGCYIYLGLSGKVGEEALEYLKMGADNNPHALRALAAVDAKGQKKRFATILADQTTDGFARDAKGRPTKKKIKMYRGGRDEVTVAAVALVAAGDAEGMNAIKFWLSMNGDALASGDGFERLFLQAVPYTDAATQAKLRPLLEKGFADAVKGGKTNEQTMLAATRAAVGLAQIGSNKGVSVIVDAITGDNAELRENVLPAIGGVANTLGSYRNGRVGLKFGGKTGLSAADGQKIVDALEKRAKFFKDDMRKQAVRALMDIKARMKVAGF